jgi:hypothetical protein
MEPLAKPTVSAEVPLIARAWEHNGEILGLDLDGELVVLARLAPQDSLELGALARSKPRAGRKKAAPRPPRPGLRAPQEEETGQETESES